MLSTKLSHTPFGVPASVHLSAFDHISARTWHSCENCEGAGGWPAYSGYEPEVYESWQECPACGGLGWIEGEPLQLSLFDLDARVGA